ncbi:DUF937 domain-containing protein [Hyphomicrobium sp.]|uniref:DUF937 domain-containing protein n=1 Tax=Hyphomicrobium sp. TaxID=82 RepID=UPI000F9BEE84|nr:DUF937 domain-containing protein [Hyphomicrobium sp.]RUP09493.1 MAG: DUF937 domain-containing protein [Hyphomicrobium sp.]
MSLDLVSNITQILSSSLVSRIASSLGLDKALTEKALQAGVPGLLAAFTSLVSRPNGAQALNGAIARQQPTLLSSLGSMLGGSAQSNIIETGTNTLTSLLGSGTTSALTNAVGQYAGIGNAGSKSLMGLLGPVVMGVLGQQQRASGLDATGLASLLNSQKDNIASALPAGFSNYLSDTGILDALGSSAGVRGPSATTGYSGSSRPSYSTMPPPVPRPTQSWGWIIPALAALLIGGLAWNWFTRPHPTETAANPPPAKVETPSTAPASTGTSTGASGLGPMPASFEALENLHGIKVGDVDVGAQLASAETSMRSAIASVQDVSTAQAAMTPLTNSANDFVRLSKLLDQLPAQSRKTVVNTIIATRPALDQLFDKALAIPGVSPIIKPTIDKVHSQFDALTTA